MDHAKKDDFLSTFADLKTHFYSLFIINVKKFPMVCKLFYNIFYLLKYDYIIHVSKLRTHMFYEKKRNIFYR